MDIESKIRKLVIENLISHDKELNEGESELKFWLNTYRNYWINIKNSLTEIENILANEKYEPKLKLDMIKFILNKSKFTV
jgi:hypothetical protein